MPGVAGKRADPEAAPPRSSAPSPRSGTIRIACLSRNPVGAGFRSFWGYVSFGLHDAVTVEEAVDVPAVEQHPPADADERQPITAESPQRRPVDAQQLGGLVDG